MIDPLPAHVCSNVVTSCMAVVPKRTPGKFRVIVVVFAPAHNSVNDNIHCDLSHVTYSSINDTALLIASIRGSIP